MMDGTSKVEVSSNGCRMSIGPNNNFQKTQMVRGLGSDFIGSWVRIGMPAKKKTLSLLGHKSLKEQCSFCEQVPQQMVNGYLYRLHLPLPLSLHFPFQKWDHDVNVHGNLQYTLRLAVLSPWKIGDLYFNHCLSLGRKQSMYRWLIYWHFHLLRNESMTDDFKFMGCITILWKGSWLVGGLCSLKFHWVYEGWPNNDGLTRAKAISQELSNYTLLMTATTSSPSYQISSMLLKWW